MIHAFFSFRNRSSNSHGLLAPIFAPSLALIVAVALVASSGCGGDDASTASISSDDAGDDSSDASDRESGSKKSGSSKSRSSQSSNSQTPVVRVKTNLGAFEITLDPEHAPVAVDNFLYNYVDRGIYDNTMVHYSSEEFLIAGGFSAKKKPIESRAPIRNESDNGLSNKKATVAMSYTGDYPHSATSHFFINLGNNDYFDYNADAEDDKKWGYTVFGEVTSGWDVVEKIAARPTHDDGEFANTPVKQVVIQSVIRR